MNQDYITAGIQGAETIVSVPEGTDFDSLMAKVQAEYDRLTQEPRIQEVASIIEAAKAEAERLRCVIQGLNELGSLAEEGHKKAHKALIATLIEAARGGVTNMEQEIERKVIEKASEKFLAAGAVHAVFADALREVATRMIPAETLRRLEAEAEYHALVARALEQEAQARTERLRELTREAAEFDGGIGLNIGVGISGELMRLAAEHRELSHKRSAEHRDTRAQYRAQFGGEF
jgi:hypothetical protein